MNFLLAGWRKQIPQNLTVASIVSRKKEDNSTNFAFSAVIGSILVPIGVLWGFVTIIHFFWDHS